MSTAHRAAPFAALLAALAPAVAAAQAPPADAVPGAAPYAPPGYAVAPPPPAYAPPGYPAAPAPYGYAGPPGAYAGPPPGAYSGAPGPYAYPYYGPPPFYPYPMPPPVAWERKSPFLMGTGITLTALGAIGVFAGSALYTSAIDAEPIYCEDGANVYKCDQQNASGRQTSGGVLIGAGIAMIAGGIPLLVIGAKRVPIAQDGSKPAASEPEARVELGPARGGVRVVF